jgi:multiple sugar transport system permease protein
VAAAGAARSGRPAALGPLPTLQESIALDVFVAALLISSAIPIAPFLIFQRLFLRGAGLSGAIKG